VAIAVESLVLAVVATDVSTILAAAVVVMVAADLAAASCNCY